MSKSFLFIIPLTPNSHLTPMRSTLRKLCLSTLTSQNYDNWKALLVGNTNKDDVTHQNFIELKFEGQKEEKLQVASKYILEKKMDCDYIIRLDDDDVFNPTLLAALSNKEFDLYVDKYHTFLDVLTGYVTQQVLYWFANTCILKSAHAFSIFGKYPPEDEGKPYKKMKEHPYLIENGHADFHLYFNEHHTILFAKKLNPVYIRNLYPDSHSSIFTGGHDKYMNNFGNWRKNNFEAFQFLKNYPLENVPKLSVKRQGAFLFFKNLMANLRAKLKYNQIVINKINHS